MKEQLAKRFKDLAQKNNSIGKEDVEKIFADLNKQREEKKRRRLE